uniref:Uncharacterized protein LOC100376274 n=1 Tax=Saccoglossus kowalevskii TaxID=10224 RepID=A0ABM0MFM5_SACKO|nr:PREDICTED: uncharacterized protein LOC100376274 [Saccoglossus kowalevskii]
MSVTQEEARLPATDHGRLPALSDTVSLVSDSSTANTPRNPTVSIVQQAAFWATDVRSRIDKNITSGKEVEFSDIDWLTQELVAVFITALQQDSHQYWLYVHEIFNLLSPYAKYLQRNQQIHHYLERIYYHIQSVKEKFFDIPMVQRMAMIFPEEMERIQRVGGNSRNYRTPTPPRPLIVTPRRSRQTDPMKLPNGNNPFVLERHDDVDKVRPKGLSFGDLAKSLPAVIGETSKREAVWSEGFGLMAQAVGTELPEHPETESQAERPTRTSEPFSWSVDPSLFKDDFTVSEEADEEPELPPMTGKEAVEMFGRGKHLGKVKFVYLNKAPSRHFTPYDLVVVPKHKANPKEHWVMSCFGVLHVYKNKPSETTTLHEWHRECVLWNTITKLPFFKEFLIKKAFLRWRANIKYSDFARIRHKIDITMIPNVPSFGAALLQISKLLQELGTIQFLPYELTQCYNLVQFEQNIVNRKKDAEVLLEKFFKFCKLVVDVTCEQTFEKLRFCETQARHQKVIFSKESLYLQRVKREQREENLYLAREETGKLGNFVRLVDQMLLAHLVALARVNISTFVGVTMQAGKEANRDALYKAKLIFTTKHALTVFPSKDKFTNTIHQILHNIPVVLCEMAQPMDLVASAPSPTHKSESTLTKSGFNTTDKTQSSGNTTKTDDESSDAIMKPRIDSPVEATKSEDEIGVATPDLCVRPETEMLIGGQGFMGQYSPLSKGNLADKLSNDEIVSEYLSLHTSIMSSSLSDIDQFCQEHAWLAEIHKFVKTWNRDSCKVFQRAEAYTIETKLGEIRNWTEQVKNVERYFVTENGLIYVDCGAIQEDIIPGLSGAFRDLLNYTAHQAKNLSTTFSTEVQRVVKGMREKNTDIESFAEYAKQYMRYKNKTVDLQTEVEYIKSLFEVIRLSYRALTSDEEKHEEKVWHAWEAFLLQLQDASEFVNTQTPIVAQQLQETFRNLTREAERICKTATTGAFLDPSQNPSKLLTHMRKLREQFDEVQTKMVKYSKYREAILGEPYDVSGLTDMMKRMEVRAELWKYVEVSTFAIQEWMQQLFKRFHVNKALDKITEWQQAAGRLKDRIPQGDEVLKHWYKLLNDFKQDLPLLQKLASDSLKPRHWKALFVGMGQIYQPGYAYTVADLLSFNLNEHSMLINTICAGATAEFALEQTLNKLRKMWELKEFQLAKHIPIIKGAKKKESPIHKGKKRGLLKKSQAESRQLPDMYTLTGYDDLKYLLQDNQVTIQSMLGSQHLAELRPEAEKWEIILQDIEDMTDLWITSQTKWQYLSKVFSDPEMCKKLPEEAIKFEDDVDLKFQEVMKAVAGDSRVLSILNKRKGAKGWRELQGDHLKQVFQTIIRKAEEILQSMERFLDDVRNQFPRLFFLSNEEVVEMISISRNTKLWLPYVRKCFTGIRSLGFALPQLAEADRMNTALDMALHADKLEVISLEGELGEKVSLVSPVEAKPDVGKWLSALELNMKTTLGTLLRVCVETRLNEGLSFPGKILEELSAFENNDQESKELSEAVKHSYRHWLLRFPAQVVLTTEALFWEKEVHNALKSSKSQEELEKIRDSYHCRFDQYLSVLHDNCHHFLTSHTRARLQVLLGGLLNQGLHLRDIIDNLLLCESPSDKCFEWLKVLRYHMDMKSVLCAQPLPPADMEDATDDSTPRRAPRMSTVVSTGYILGECNLHQLGGSFPYDHEYIGPTSRLVVTPLTDRCHMTLTMALKNHQCGTIMGPSGTGKSETIRDLAKTMGRHCVTFNCNESLHANLMSRLLTGAIQAGSWLVWDDMDRMPYEMMSVIAQELEYLKQTYRVLESTGDNQYGTRGTTRQDKRRKTKRRNSLTTLHSLPTRPNLEKEKTFPNYTKGPVTNYFEETFGGEEDADDEWEDYQDISVVRQRRYSISKAVHLEREDYYEEISPIPLFGDMHGPARYMRTKNKTDASFAHLSKWSYTPTSLGNLLFNGNLLTAGGNFGSFMTLNSDDRKCQDIPFSLRLVMRPVAMVKPDRLRILEAILCYKGFGGFKELACKLNIFYDIIEKQLPDDSSRTIGPGLRAMKISIQIATVKLFGRRQLHQLGSGKSTSSAAPSVSEIQEENDIFDGTDISEFDDDSIREEAALLFGVQKTLLSRLHCVEALQVVKQAIRTVFPHSSRPASAQEHDPALVSAIQEQLVTDQLQATPQHVSKILQLYESLQQKSGVVLVGASGSGKTTSYKTLGKVLNTLHLHPPSKEDTMQPTAPIRGLRIKLFGCNTRNGAWQEGIVPKLLHEANAQTVAAAAVIEQHSEKPSAQQLAKLPSIVKKWIVLDGNMSSQWVDNMNTLLDEHKKLCLNNGEQVNIMDSTSMVFETCSITNSSPSLLGRSAIVYCGSDVVHWKMLFESWLQTAKNKWELFNVSLKVLSSLVDDTFGATIKFLTSECASTLTADTTTSLNQNNGTTTGIQEVTSFLNILSSLFDKHLLREDEDEGNESDVMKNASSAPLDKLETHSRPVTGSTLSRQSSSLEDTMAPNHIQRIVGMFTFAYIWGFGGKLHERYIEEFDSFTRHTLHRARHDIRLPNHGLVFDYAVEVNTGMMITWREFSQDGVKTLPTGYTIVPEVERYAYLIDLLLGSNHPVMLTGPPGVGKTSLIQNMVPNKHYFTRMVLSTGMDSPMMQQMIEKQLDRVRQRMPVAATDQRKNKASHLFFLDDLNATSSSDTGSIPCLELLRQMLSQCGVYDRHRFYLKPIDDAKFLASSVSPGVSGIGTETAHQIIDPRLARLFTVFTLFPLTSQAMHQVYGKPLQNWLEEFPAYSISHHYELAHAILSATMDLFNMVKKNLTPTPVNAHYIFTLHDVARCISSMFLLSPRSRGRPKPGRKRGGGGGGGGGAGGGGSGASAAKSQSSQIIKSASIPSVGGQSSDSSQASNVKQSQSWMSFGSTSDGKGVPTVVTPPLMRLVVRLWCHEASRTYYDRLISEEDQVWFTKQLLDVVERHFCSAADDNGGQEMETIHEQLEQLDSESEVIRVKMPENLLKRSSVTPLSSISTVTTPRDEDRKTSTPVAQSDERKSQTPRKDISEGRSPLLLVADETEAKKGKGSTPQTTVTTSSTTPWTERETETESRASQASTSSETTSGDVTPYLPTPRSETRKESTSERDTGTGTGSRKGASTGILRISSTPSKPSTPGVLKPTTPGEAKSGGYRRGVTFKPGLIGDAHQGRYTGPLIPMDQICNPGQNLCNILFSMSLYASGDRGYNESTSSQLMDGVTRCLNLYNEKYATKKLDIVLFKEALHHIARITRVLGTTGGNALLLGKTHCTGRTTLTKLAAYAARCKLYEPKPSFRGDMAANRMKLRQYIRESSNIAGLHGKPVVLLVRDTLGEQCLEDVCAVMSQGTLPGLYSDEEIEEIATAMLPGSKGGGHRGQRLEMAVERYYRRVCNNMHIIVCMDFSDINYSNSIEILRRFPALLTRCCCVDVYFPWSHEALVSVAHQWIRRDAMDKFTGKLYKVPWRLDDPASQLSAVCNAMAYIHQSAEHMIEGLFKAQFKFYTPTTYLEFIDLFKHIASKMASHHQKTISTYERALSRIDVAYNTIDSYNNDVGRMTPMLQQGASNVDDKRREVEALKELYQKAKEECALDEAEIAKMSAPLERRKKEAQEEQEKVDPIYDAALSALKSLNPLDVNEIRSYRVPPAIVVNVVNALCLLFKQPYDWESGKGLLNRENFFQDLEFYDKDNIPEDIFQRLNILFIQDPEFRPEVVGESSKAASSLCLWVHAIYAYSEIHRNLQPKLEAVADQEAKINEALRVLGEKRKRFQEIKYKLENKIQMQRDAMRSVRNMEKSMRETQKHIAKATALVDNMSTQNTEWRSRLSQAQYEYNTAPGDALIAAACVCYHGPMEQFARDVLVQDWIERCRTGKFVLQSFETELPVAQSVTPALELVIQANKDEKPGSRKGSRETNSAGSTKLKLQAEVEAESIYSDGTIDREETPDTAIGSLGYSDLHDALTPANIVQIRDPFTLQDVLSSVEEQGDWYHRSIPHDNFAVQNALILRSYGRDGRYSWPLIIDPDNQAGSWIQLLQETIRSNDDVEEEATRKIPLSVIDEKSEPGDVVVAATVADEVPITDWESHPPDDDGGRETGFTISTIVETEGDPFTPRTVTSFGDAVTPATTRDPYADSETATDIHGGSEVDMFEAWDIDIDTDLELPMDNLWMVSADDPNLNYRVVHSVAFGLTLVITHVERLPPDYALYELLHRNITVDVDGKHHIKLGGNDFDYNPDFRLYLLTSVPIHIKGTGLLPLPIQQCSVVDLSLSQQGVFDKVLKIVLDIERPEYENQYRSIESDLKHYQQQLENTQNAILHKTLNLKLSVLEDGDMLPSLINCQQQTFSLQTSLAETKVFAEQLDEKRRNYIPVAKHGSVLYSVIKHFPKLHQLYQFKLSAFLSVVSTMMKSRSQGKAGAMGVSPKARTSELIDALTQSIHEFVSTAVSSQHSQLFAFLVAMEKLRMTGGVTNQEWSIFVDGINDDVMEIKDVRRKPDWMPQKAWIDFGILEGLEDFEGIRDSMVKYEKQWQEYFECTPVLLSLVPDDNQAHLSIIQKAILWRIIQPHLLYQLCHDITVYQLGAAIAKSDNYNICKILTNTDQHTPIVFIRPASYHSDDAFSSSKGHCLFDPVLEMMHYGKQTGMEGCIHVVTLGTPVQMDEAVQVIQDSMLSGHWVILNNCHLAETWTKDIIKLIQPICDLLFAVSLLHTVLNQRRLYHQNSLIQDCYWSHGELQTAIDCLQSVAKTCGFEMHSALQYILGNVVYGGHTLDPNDLSSIRAVADGCLLPVNHDKLQDPNMMGVVSLLKSLVPEDDISAEADGSYHGYQEVFDKMKETVTTDQLGLAETANVALQSLLSRNLLDGLKKIAGMSNFGPSLQMDILDNISQCLEDVTSYLQNLAPLPQPPEESLSYLNNFLATEVIQCQKLVNRIHSDIQLALTVAKGETASTQETERMLQSLKMRTVPQSWLPADYPSSLAVKNFFDNLNCRIFDLTEYCDPQRSTAVYNLSVFSNPGMFLQCIVMEHARKEYLEVQHITLHSQVLGFSHIPSSSPEFGVYLTGLHLHNAFWDSRHASILHAAYKPSLSIPSQLPIVWLKPVNENEKNEQSYPTFRCPVIAAVEQRERFTDKRVVCHIDLPCTNNIELCLQRRIYASSQI